MFLNVNIHFIAKKRLQKISLAYNHYVRIPRFITNKSRFISFRIPRSLPQYTSICLEKSAASTYTYYCTCFSITATRGIGVIQLDLRHILTLHKCRVLAELCHFVISTLNLIRGSVISERCGNYVINTTCCASVSAAVYMPQT